MVEKMRLMELFEKRYSVRRFLPQAVPEKELDEILQAGRLAPSAHSVQPQRVLVVKSEEGLAKLRKITPSVFNAPLVLIVCGDRSVAWVNPWDKINCAEMDSSIVTTLMMLKATEAGIGSCWICNFERKLVKEAFDIPEKYDVECLLLLGYSDIEPAKHHYERTPLENTVFYEHFDR
jgi:nitroreductase